MDPARIIRMVKPLNLSLEKYAKRRIGKIEMVK